MRTSFVFGLLAAALVCAGVSTADESRTKEHTETRAPKRVRAANTKRAPARRPSSTEASTERLNVSGTGIYQPGGEAMIPVNSVFDSSSNEE